MESLESRKLWAADWGEIAAPPESVSSDLTLGENESVQIRIDGTIPGEGPGSHDQIDVEGTVQLAGGLELLRDPAGIFQPRIGDRFTIINNDQDDPVEGTFDGLPEGGTIFNFLDSGLQAFITYAGGTGNDVTIEVSPHIAVDTPIDELDGDYQPGDLSLREAIQIANGNPDLTIHFDTTLNTVPIELTIPGAEEDGNATGDLDINVLGALRGNGPDKTIIIAPDLGDRVFDVHAEAQFHISGISVQHARAESGGGIFNRGRLMISDSRLHDLTIDGRGGGAIFNDGGALSITDSSITGNTAQGGSDQGNARGGGIFSVGGAVQISSSDVHGNTAAGEGGGIALESNELTGGSLSLTHVNLESNSATHQGGGLYIHSEDLVSGVSVEITNVTVSGNSAGDTGGGIGIVTGASTGIAQVRVVDGSVRGNTAGREGGGLWNDAGGTMTLTGTSVFGNSVGSATQSARGGGGVFNNGGTLSISNATITGNTASGESASGGGIFQRNGQVQITGGEVTGNTAFLGGGGLHIESDDIVTGANAGLSDVHVSGNSAGTSGGGIDLVTGAGSGEVNVRVVDGTVHGNTAGQEGGGLWNDARGTMTITGTTISGNTVSDAADTQGGGGVFNNGGTLSISNATITSNSASANGSGGGVFNRGGTLTIEGTSIASNSAVRAGGGIEILSEGSIANSVSISNSQLVANTADGRGGGFHVGANGDVAGVDIRIDGGVIDRNVAALQGGGLWNDARGTMTITGTLIDGNTAGSESADAQGGGGVFNNGGTLTISHATIQDNTATHRGSGGGILNDGGTLTIEGGTISNNEAVRAGGGIEIRSSDPTRSAQTQLFDVDVSGNSTGSSGGGLHVAAPIPDFPPSQLYVFDSSLTGNTADREGGGLWNSRGDITIVGSTIDGNTAGMNAADSGDGGGGIFNDGGVVFIDNSSIRGNTALAGAGGGILNNQGGLNLFGTTIAGNQARVAGGVLIQDSSAQATNVTISNNAANGPLPSAGGIVVGASLPGRPSELVLLHTTIALNVGGNVQAITLPDSQGTLIQYQNSLFALPSGGTNFSAFAQGPTPIFHSLGNNLADDSTGNLFGPGDLPDTDPKLLPLRDNGGSTHTHALGGESPAIDAAADEPRVPIDILGNLFFDQRGAPFLRNIDGDGDGDGQPLPDIGAIEVQTIDFGDAPDRYRTLFASGGPSHHAVGPRLGDLRDGEVDGAPSPDADGDDQSRSDDEDGVMFGKILLDRSMAAVNIDLQNAPTAFVDAWIDFAGDGVFDPADKILDGQVLTNVGGFATHNFTIPDGTRPGQTLARVRVSSFGGLPAHGPAGDGEVEDYLVSILENDSPVVERVRINDGQAQRSTVTELQVTFSHDVKAPVEAFHIHNATTGEQVEPVLLDSVVTRDGKTVATLGFASGPSVLRRFSGNSLIDGNYLLTVNHTQIEPTAGGPAMEATFTFGDQANDLFFRLFGDDDGDRDVDGNDLSEFGKTAFQTAASSSFNWALDHDGDDDVDGDDYREFLFRKFGAVL